jgi:hypothetical protein
MFQGFIELEVKTLTNSGEILVETLRNGLFLETDFCIVGI